MQSSDCLRCVYILNHKITPLIRLLIIQRCPMKKQTLSQEFQQNNIKSLKKLVKNILHFVKNSSHYIYSLRGQVITTVLILLFYFYSIETEILCVSFKLTVHTNPTVFLLTNVLCNRWRVATLFTFLYLSHENSTITAYGVPFTSHYK